MRAAAVQDGEFRSHALMQAGSLHLREQMDDRPKGLGPDKATAERAGACHLGPPLHATQHFEFFVYAGEVPKAEICQRGISQRADIPGSPTCCLTQVVIDFRAREVFPVRSLREPEARV